MLPDERDSIFQSAEDLARRGQRSKKRFFQIGGMVAGVAVAVAGSVAGYRAWRARQPLPPIELDPIDEAAPAAAATKSGTAGQGGPADPPDSSPEEVPPEIVGAPDPTDARVRVFASNLGTGGTLYEVLVAIGVTPVQIREVTDALKDTFDFRTSQPDHEYSIRQDRETKNVLSLSYRVSETEVYEVSRAADGRMRARRKNVVITRRRTAAAGVVETSLFEAVDRAGLRPGIVPQFVEVFASGVNFFTDQRRGDTFRVLVDEEYVDGEFVRYGNVLAIEYRGQRVGEQRAYFFRDPGGICDYYDERGRSVHGSMLKTPLRYMRITSGFNPRRFHPILHRVTGHMGVDYAAPTGTPVWATADGTAVSVGPAGGAGNLVVLRHEGGIESLYMHLSRFAAGLREGQRVRQRQVIGYVGTTGLSTGPHLHFSLRRGGAFVNPLAVQSGPGRQLPPAERAAFGRQVAELVAALPPIPGRGAGPTGASVVARDEPAAAPAKR